MGRALTVIVEGLPAGLAIDFDAMDHHLRRRQLGYGRGQRMAIESRPRRGPVGRSPRAGPPARPSRSYPQPRLGELAAHHARRSRDAGAGRERAPSAPAVTRPRPGHADLAGALKYERRRLARRARARQRARNRRAGGRRRDRPSTARAGWRRGRRVMSSASAAPASRRAARSALRRRRASRRRRRFAAWTRRREARDDRRHRRRAGGRRHARRHVRGPRHAACPWASAATCSGTGSSTAGSRRR